MTFALELLAAAAGLIAIGAGIGIWAASRYRFGQRKPAHLVRRNGLLWATAPMVDAEYEEIRSALKGEL